jgi:hypothetical protein
MLIKLNEWKNIKLLSSLQLLFLIVTQSTALAPKEIGDILL